MSEEQSDAPPKLAVKSLESLTSVRALLREAGLGSGSGGRGRTERDPESTKVVHQTDGIGEHGEFVVAEFFRCSLVLGTRSAGFGATCDGFIPCNTRCMPPGCGSMCKYFPST